MTFIFKSTAKCGLPKMPYHSIDLEMEHCCKQGDEMKSESRGGNQSDETLKKQGIIGCSNDDLNYNLTKCKIIIFPKVFDSISIQRAKMLKTSSFLLDQNVEIYLIFESKETFLTSFGKPITNVRISFDFSKFKIIEVNIENHSCTFDYEKEEKCALLFVADITTMNNELSITENVTEVCLWNLLSVFGLDCKTTTKPLYFEAELLNITRMHISCVEDKLNESQTRICSEDGLWYPKNELKLFCSFLLILSKDDYYIEIKEIVYEISYAMSFCMNKSLIIKNQVIQRCQNDGHWIPTSSLNNTDVNYKRNSNFVFFMIIMAFLFFTLIGVLISLLRRYTWYKKDYILSKQSSKIIPA